MINKIVESFAYAVAEFSKAAAESHKAMFDGLAAMHGIDPYEPNELPKAEFNIYQMDLTDDREEG